MADTFIKSLPLVSAKENHAVCFVSAVLYITLNIGAYILKSCALGFEDFVDCLTDL